MRTIKLLGLTITVLGLLTAIIALITEGIRLYKELPVPTSIPDVISSDQSVSQSNFPTAKVQNIELYDNCYSRADIELSGFSPNSYITVTSNAYDINCETGEWANRTWSQTHFTPTDSTGYLVIEYTVARGEYNYTFTDKDGNKVNLSFEIGE